MVFLPKMALFAPSARILSISTNYIGYAKSNTRGQGLTGIVPSTLRQTYEHTPVTRARRSCLLFFDNKIMGPGG